MKSCELCKCTAWIYCESDQARLCWTCDAKVHSANFLVARHLRILLCHSCQSPTPWSASGEKLGRTVSLCVRCVGCDRLKERERERIDESRGSNDDDFESETEYDSDEDDDDDDDDRLDEDEEDDGDNQVVPWSSTSPPQVASSSESEEFSNDDIDVASKRSRENDADLSSKDDFNCSTSRRNNQLITSETAAARCIRGGEDAFVDSLYLRPLKMRKFDANRAARVQHTSGTETIVEALERFHEQDLTSSINNKASEAVDLDPSECP